MLRGSTIPQESEPFENFTVEERTIRVDGTSHLLGREMNAPVRSPYGVTVVRVRGIRRHDGAVQFGVGDKEGPILDWITKSEFWHEWPN